MTEELVEKPPPPILIKNIQNFNAMCALIMQHIGDNFTTRKEWDDAAKCNVQLLTQTPDDYRKIVKVLDEKKADYHCYQLKEDKAFRVTLRYLDPTTDIKVLTKLKEKHLP
jgi:hypothetical protein